MAPLGPTRWKMFVDGKEIDGKVDVRVPELEPVLTKVTASWVIPNIKEMLRLPTKLDEQRTKMRAHGMSDGEFDALLTSVNSRAEFSTNWGSIGDRLTEIERLCSEWIHRQC